MVSGCQKTVLRLADGSVEYYGADYLGELYAEHIGVKVAKFPANWTKYGPAAGPIRNAQMAKYADALVAVWDGDSKGTANMIQEMRVLGKPIHVYVFTKKPI